MLHIIALLALLPQNDKAQANAYDDAWETGPAGWVTHCRAILSAGSGKTTGFVLQIGDSITHSNPYSQWPRSPNGASGEDTTILNWCQAALGFPISNNNDPSVKNGFYLAAADTDPSNRGMTAASGLDTIEALSGDGNGGTAMPTQTDPATARATVASTTYTANLNLYTVAAAFNDAQFAVLMLGTNDMEANRAVDATLTNLTSIVDALELRNIVVILSTIPPHYDSVKNANVVSYNNGVRSLAQNRGLPLIDFYAEILARRPGTTWNGTLLQSNNLHPTASSGSYTSSSDPYADGGDSITHATGAACLNVGYLLRSWLTVQKLKEVKSYVVDGAPPPPAPAPVPPPAPPGPDLNDGENGDDGINDTLCGGSVGAAGPGGLGLLALAAALAIAAGARRP